MLFKLILKILRLFPPELSSSLSLNSIKILNYLNKNLLNSLPNSIHLKKVKIENLEFNHYLGLSAGIDKKGKYFNSLNSLGFSFIEIGTFTPNAQKGNELPRIKRIEEYNSFINRLGFNNPGIERGMINVKRNKKNFSGILGISIGKNKNTPLEEAYKDYIFCLEHAFRFADYIAVNISSPNTENLRELSSPDYIGDLTNEICNKAIELEMKFSKKVPIFLKISPDENDEKIEEIISSSLRNGFKGFIISNTTQGTFHGISGGISGELLKDKATKLLYKANQIIDQDVVLIASGGITSKEDVEERLDNGANLIQIYTSFVYKGPEIIKELLI